MEGPIQRRSRDLSDLKIRAFSIGMPLGKVYVRRAREFFAVIEGLL